MSWKNWSYLVKGGVLGFYIGIFLTIFFTWVFKSLGCGISGGCSSEQLFSLNKIGDALFGGFIFGFVPAIILGIIIGWIYGKVKGKK